MSIIPVYEREVTGMKLLNRTVFLLGALPELDRIANQAGRTPVSYFCSYENEKPKGARWFFLKNFSFSGSTKRYIDRTIASTQGAQWFLASEGYATVTMLRTYLESYIEMPQTVRLAIHEFVVDVVDELEEIEEQLQQADKQQARFRLVIQEQHTMSKVALRW